MTSPSVKPPESRWRRHFFYRKESLRTTWKLRFSVAALCAFIIWITSGFWTVRLGRSLICPDQTAPSDALLLEDFDTQYLVFESAMLLMDAGMAARVIVPTQADRNGEADPVARSIVEVMAQIASLKNIEILPIRQTEPITLNAGRQIRDFLIREHVKSVIVVTRDFRSRRSLLVYDSVLTPAGITVRCYPVLGTTRPENWTTTWHGIEDVGMQFLKLQYYRFYVLW